jgi:hypothetical protein
MTTPTPTQQARYDAARAAVAKYVRDNVPAQYSWVLSENAAEVDKYETGVAQAAVDAADADAACAQSSET